MPLLYAIILFLVIRVVNDVPAGVNYFHHSWQFIAVEFAGVFGGSFLCWYLGSRWIRFCHARHVAAWAEYAVVCLVPALLVLSVMALSHEAPLRTELRLVVVPLAVTVLMSLWMYLAVRNRFVDKLCAAALLNEQAARSAGAEAKLQLLRAQLHPHFLFNMLNTLYFTVDENNTRAREAIEHLSDLLRFQLYTTDGVVAVERELAVLRSYLELCRLRFGDGVDIRTDIDTGMAGDEIHPHLLLPLVENAFKHSGGTPRIITISLKRCNGMLELQVGNTLPPVQGRAAGGSGVGLANLRKRLALLYPGRHTLAVTPSTHNFSACLKIEL